jgi:hypothetical protein
MRPLSATEAISPAIEHTKTLLRPFSLGLWLKLGLVAIFAEMGGQFIAPPFGNFSHHGSQTSGIGAIAGGITPLLVEILVAAAVVGLLIGLGLLYLGSRLQLVLMDLVATRTTFVRPAWHRTASRTWRWIGGKVVFFLIVFAGVAVLAAGPILYFVRSMPAGNGQLGAAFVGSFILFFLALFFLILLIMLAIWVLRDFVLPFILFEDASFGDALRRASALIRNEPGPVLFYLFMKVVLSMAAGIAAELCIFAVAAVAAIPTGLVAFGLWTALHHSGPFGTVTMYIGFALLGVLFVAALLVAIVCLGGATLIFYQAYALYFIGGRIPQVGILLQPPPPFYPSMPAPPFAPV